MVLAVELRDLTRAALALAGGSAVLGLIFMGFDAPLAGVIEVSVGAGLITVLMMATISIIGGRKEDDDHEC
jgi:NADH:ubiquinone oxidoreductase subunit 6 (subunit J)